MYPFYEMPGVLSVTQNWLIKIQNGLPGYTWNPLQVRKTVTDVAKLCPLTYLLYPILIDIAIWW